MTAETIATPKIATTTSIIPLTRTETALLRAAAADDGRVTLAVTTKPATRARLLARFLRDRLVTAPDGADGPHRLTAVGYRAVGLTPPKPSRKAKIGAETPAADVATVATTVPDAAPSKKVQVLALLQREQGAMLAELIAATSWLPHSARAALSRIRTGGQVLLKTVREDAATVYRIPAPVAVPARVRKPRRIQAAGAATAQVVAAGVPASAAA